MRCQSYALPGHRQHRTSSLALKSSTSASSSSSAHASAVARGTQRAAPCAAACARRRRAVPCAAAAAGNGSHNLQQSSSDDDVALEASSSLQLPHKGAPAQQLERAWREESADMSQLAGEFLQPLRAPEKRAKVFVFVRHGHSTWNEQSRIQGNTNESQLTDLGRAQAACAAAALEDIPFDSCFSSPHTRATQTTGIVWRGWQRQGRPAPHFLPSLSEVDLGWFQGLRNEDIAASHPDLYRVWREEPEAFVLDGRAPVLDAFRQSRRAWTDMLSFPGQRHLVVTHKSLLRAMLCTALGLPPRQFRAIDVANGAVCMVRCNARGDVMLSALNLTSHLVYPDVRYVLPGTNQNDRLAAATGYVAAATAAAGANGSSAGSGGGSGGGGKGDSVQQ